MGGGGVWSWGVCSWGGGGLLWGVSTLGVSASGGASGPGVCLLPGGVCSQGVPAPGGVYSKGVPAPGGSGSGGVPGEDSPGQLLLRVVRILLECILVSVYILVMTTLRGQ